MKANLAEIDKSCIWHPFTQMKDYAQSDPIIISQGEGIKLIDTKGREYYDGVSSLWVNVHGHRVPEIDAAIINQLARIGHSTLLGLANEPSIHLAEKLVRITPEKLKKVFYSDSGSEAVEIGLKIAYQYWHLKGDHKRKKFISMTNAYHGDTIGSTSVGGMDLFHATYKDLLFEKITVPYPFPYRYCGSSVQCAEHTINSLKNVLETRHQEIIGLILEPMVQGAAGMVVMPEGVLTKVAELCRGFEILFLTDEVATGFGRTGKMFACEHEDIQPDIMMLAKGLTGGYLPLAATLTSNEVYSAFLGDYEEKKTFFHGHTYTGNQLACSAALANLDLFEKTDLIQKVQEKSLFLASLLEPFNELPHVGDIRNKGFMTGIELVKDKKTKEPYPWEEKIGVQVCDRCRDLGMIIRPLGNVIVFMPPPR